MRIIPSNVKLRSNYGLELKERGRVEEARRQYEVYIIVGNESILSRIACAALKKLISLVTHIMLVQI